jgi:hypothetical protein
VDVKWNQVAATPFDSIKGYLVTTGVPYQPDLIHFDYYVTNPAAPGYNPLATNPCGVDGAATSCAVSLQFPMTTTNGRTLAVNGVYSTSVLAIYMDGHRSDGRCDNGTALGFAPPCADGSIPQFAEPGFTSVNYMLRSRAWPLKYSQLITRQVGDSSDRDRVRVDQIYVLFADLDQHQAEFVLWQPYGVSYPMTAATILGANSPGLGTIAFLDNTNTQGKRFGLQAVITPLTGVRGRFEIFANTIQLSSHAELVMSAV